MAASSRTGHSRASKKVWILGICVVVVIALYTAAWFLIAGEARARLLAVLNRGDPSAVSVECPDADIRGFPFRFGLFCSGVNIDDRARGISASFGALRSAGQVYAPWHVVAELDQPAVIRDAAGRTFSAEWGNLLSSAQLNLDGVEKTSLAVDDLKASLVSALAGTIFNLTAKHGEVHLRQNGNDLDAAVTLDAVGAILKDEPQGLPPLALGVDITLIDKALLLRGGRMDTLRGTQGELRTLSANLGAGRIANLTGPFSVDDEGYLTGELTLEVEGIDGWRDAIKTAFPQAAKTIDTAGNMLTALVSGGTKVSVNLSVVKGKMLVSGFIPIGEIPPI